MMDIGGSTYHLIVHFLESFELLGRCRFRHGVGSGDEPPGGVAYVVATWYDGVEDGSRAIMSWVWPPFD